ncbi:MAG: hypothetical protein Q8K55_02120 [Gemmatimonadaceae bacterium]|nr:hypothetical protein [Gemmatimonadaceae bacterium]
MSRTGILVGLALTIPMAAPRAQEVTVPIGTKVRVESTVKRKLDGVLLARDVDSITVVNAYGTVTTMPTASVVRIRIRDGRSHKTGAVRGLLYGAITGIAIGEAAQRYYGNMPVGLYHSMGAVYGTVLGGVIGAVVGTQRWKTVYGRNVGVSYRPDLNGRLSVGLRIN